MTYIYDSDRLAANSDLPEIESLPERKDFPDPLKMLDGSRVSTADQWTLRKDELASLFQHYVYGYFPPATEVSSKVLFEDSSFMDGRATLKEVQLTLDAAPQQHINVLIAAPNIAAGNKKPAVFVGANFGSNMMVVSDPRVAEPQNTVPDWTKLDFTGKVRKNIRGSRARRWPVVDIINRGYAQAVFYNGDLAPDDPDSDQTIHRHYWLPGQTSGNKHDWGTLAAWAWGMMRVVDYLQTDSCIDPTRIASVGHSRNGKVALLAAAFDERIAMAIPNQSGCGGAAPSRTCTGETLTDINRVFPHWFNDVFPKFSSREQFLPIDQHCLLAMCAPRPVLCTNARKDEWANPTGQFEMLKRADNVYKLLGSEGLATSTMPGLCKLVGSPLGYWIRPGKHMQNPHDWKIFMDFADRHL